MLEYPYEEHWEDGSLPEIQRDQSNQLILFYNGPVSEN